MFPNAAQPRQDPRSAETNTDTAGARGSASNHQWRLGASDQDRSGATGRLGDSDDRPLDGVIAGGFRASPAETFDLRIRLGHSLD